MNNSAAADQTHADSPASSSVTRFLLENLDIRGAVVQLNDVWQCLQADRHYPACVSHLLGQMAAVAAVIAGNLKQPGRLTFQIQGSGAVSLLVVDCSEALNIRAMARFDAERVTGLAEDCEIRQLIGDGRLQLTLDAPSMREPYISLVPLEGHSVAEIFEHYLTQSEQQPAGLWLACDEQHAVALFLQKMPGADVRDEDGWDRVHTLAQTVKAQELFELSATDLLGRLFAEEDVRVFPARTVEHNWPSNRDKVTDMLRALGQAEVERILAEQGEIVVEDDLTNQRYRFTEDDLEEIFPTAPPEGIPPNKPTLH